jgi:ABC-type amino acid transport system permease subunit
VDTNSIQGEASLQFDGTTLTVGATTDGYDVKFWGNTSNTYMLWDEDTDDLVLTLGAELYFYDAAGGEHIKSDGTDMTIYAGNDLNLTAVTDINIPINVGLTFAATEKIESDGTDLSITVGASGDINIPVDIGLTFGNDGEKIEGDGTHLTVASSGNLTLVPDGELILGSATGIAQMQTNGITFGLASSAPAPDSNKVHIWNGTAGSITANVESLLVLENNSSALLTFLVANTYGAGIFVGEPANGERGTGILYNYYVSDAWTIRMEGTNRLNYSASAFAFQEETEISTTAGALKLAPTTNLVLNSINAGVTADTGSSQNDGAITKLITQIAVCANAGDAVTLPAAVAGSIIIVMNDGANAADVFPASGDNIDEAGTNTAYSLAVNKNAMFIAHDAEHWSIILTA